MPDGRRIRRNPEDARAETKPKGPAAKATPSSDLLGLQRSAGNAAVVAMLGQSRAAPTSPAPATAGPKLPALLRRQLDPDTIQRKGNSRQRRNAAKKKAAAAASSASTTTAETESGETETAETTTETPTTETTRAETESGETETTETEPEPEPEPEPEVDPKVAALTAVIGEGPMGRMTTQFGSEDDVVAFADEVGNQRLKYLIETQRMTAAALEHYGAKMLKSFVGVGEKAWKHLTTAKLNSTGQISGGHDSAVFYAFLDSVDYELDGERGNGTVWKAWYKDAEGRPKGSKSLIQGLTTSKATWVTAFNNAIWGAVRGMTLQAGTNYVSDDDGYRYGLYWKDGAAQVDTIYPADV